MTTSNICFVSFTAFIALVGAIALMAVALDVVSVPTPIEAIQYVASSR
jgi:hypothetical protein